MALKDVWTDFVGGPTTTSTSTTATPVASTTNYGMLIGGIVLAVGTIVVLYFVFKPKKNAG